MADDRIVYAKKTDIGLILVLAALAVSLLFLSAAKSRQPAAHPRLEILTGNTVYGVYDLTEDQEIRIGETNVCEIKNQEVRMTEADCPDQICVHSAAVTEKGGSIVCLPNHIVLHIIDADGAEREVDTIAE